MVTESLDTTTWLDAFCRLTYWWLDTALVEAPAMGAIFLALLVWLVARLYRTVATNKDAAGRLLANVTLGCLANLWVTPLVGIFAALWCAASMPRVDTLPFLIVTISGRTFATSLFSTLSVGWECRHLPAAMGILSGESHARRRSVATCAAIMWVVATLAMSSLVLYASPVQALIRPVRDRLFGTTSASRAASALSDYLLGLFEGNAAFGLVFLLALRIPQRALLANRSDQDNRLLNAARRAGLINIAVIVPASLLLAATSFHNLTERLVILYNLGIYTYFLPTARMVFSTSFLTLLALWWAHTDIPKPTENDVEHLTRDALHLEAVMWIPALVIAIVARITIGT